MEKLDQLEMILEVLFCCCSSQWVLSHCAELSGIREDDFVKIAFRYSAAKTDFMFSQDDLRNQFRFFRQQVNLYAPSDDGATAVRVLKPLDCLFYYAGRMLHIEDNQVVCRYRRLLNWSGLTRRIDADLLVSAFYAAENQDPKGMNWKLTLDHDNFQLKQIMKRGIAENHFHLYGSAPVFHLAWISLMNRLDSSNAAGRLKRYDRDRKEPETRVDTSLFEPPMRLMHLQAAAIRLILFCALTLDERPDYGFISLSGQIESKDWHDESSQQKQCVRERLRKMIVLLCTRYDNVEDSLLELEYRVNALQHAISALRDWNHPTLPDYALLVCHGDLARDDDNIFQGERWLLYHCLHRIRSNMLDRVYANLFYAYLILKERIRHELIQSEDGVGFSNFQDYERRKFDLMEDSILQGKLGATARAAVRRELLQNPHLRSLEIRVTPCESAEENVDMLRNLDRILGGEQSDATSVPRGRYFYVFHFLKKADDWRKADPSAFYCRHYLYRRKLLRQTIGIQRLRKCYGRRAMQVYGIDAASKELTCRPEVFGTCFRFLHKHSADLEENGTSHPLPQLRRTIHVGEDFLDVADGLRAIDEAIHFLGLESGDRLGHALALGIDARAWYAAKNNVITLPAQDYLDTVVWLYRHLLKYQLPDMMDVLEYLKREFSRLADRIFKRHMSSDAVFRILSKYHEDETIPPKYKWYQSDAAYDHSAQAWVRENSPTTIPFGFNFDIHQYYRAWKLRGDDPELYDDGYFKDPASDDLYDACRVNAYYPKDKGIRYDPGVFLIHYYYHYSREVRAEGERQIQQEVPQAYIDAVVSVQRAMQKEIGKLGLGIECNPTSNVLIGTFKRYEQHPILRFYNRELEVDSTLLDENPQLLVSINTDDKGIFSTSLENEYALMACALEKAVKPDGSMRYPRQRVYAWLDDVRKMGLEQSFRNSHLEDQSISGGNFHMTVRRRRRN